MKWGIRKHSKTFSINLNDHYHEKLEKRRSNSYGGKTLIMRLAIEANLIRMTPVGLALATSNIQGPHRHKHTFVIPNKKKDRKWYDTVQIKAERLDTTVAQLVRVCLCLFLDELEAIEEEKEHDSTV